MENMDIERLSPESASLVVAVQNGVLLQHIGEYMDNDKAPSLGSWMVTQGHG